MGKNCAIDSSHGGDGGMDSADLDVPQQSVFFALLCFALLCFARKVLLVFGLHHFM